MRKLRIGWVIVTAVALISAGCSLLGPDDPIRDDSGEIVEGSDSDVFAVRVGDCLNVSDLAETVTTVPTVPCTQVHDGEVYASTMLPEGAYPGLEAVDLDAFEFCHAEFEGFIGVAWEQSEFDLTYLTPTESGWENQNDREIVCIALDPSASTTGSMRGVGR